MKQIIIRNNVKYEKQDYKKEEDLTTLFEKRYKVIISDHSFFIKRQKQFKSKKFKNFKHSIGDGFLLVWDNPTTPTLYIVEVELIRHNINKHILPQLGDFISFIQSSTIEELNEVRNYLYNEIKKNKSIFEKIQKETSKEVYELLDNAMEDLQILLVIDSISPELSIGLSQIEKAINVKIRKIEVSLFRNENNEEIILFTDSEIEEYEKEITHKAEEYTLDYHLEGKPEKIANIVNSFLKYIKGKGIKESPMKHYIGFYKNKNMILSCVVRKNSVVFYSKARIDEVNIPEGLQARDVRKIGHYTNHLPTEIVIKEPEEINELLKYFDEVYKRF